MFLFLLKQRHLIDSTDSHGRTALHVAVDAQNMVCTKILLDSGGEFSITIDEDVESISDAIVVSLVSSLSCTADADAVAPSLGLDDETRLSQIETPLHIAGRKRNYSLASLILQAGANPNIPIIIVGSDDCEKLSSTALKEACRYRDSSLVDLLIRYGARDDECQALQVAADNNDFHLMSRLLALKSFADPEFKISKKAVELPGLYPTAAGGGTSVTFSSMFPTTPVMINWHSLNGCLKNIRKTWLIDAALAHNIKLKLNIQNQSVCLMAVTRLDLSNNGLKKLPLCIFQMPSLRILTLSQNKLDSLPETESSDATTCATGNRMRKSSSYSSSLTVGSAMVWVLPCLEELHLQDNRLESVPVCVFDLPSLQLLDLSNNKLRCLPSRLWSAPKLRDLNLSMNLLRDLPNSRTLTPQKTADDSGFLSSPRLQSSSSLESESSTNRSPSISQSSSQRQLDLSESGVHETKLDNVIPREVNHVNLFGNQVSLASSSFHEEEKSRSQSCPLSLLNLSHNGFTSIPVVISCLATNLTRLNMSYNCLTTIGSVKLYPSSLKHLDLSFNQLNSWSTVELEYDETKCARNMSSPSDSSPLRTVVRNKKTYCLHRHHVRLDNLRSLILANNQLQSLNLLTEDTDQEDEPSSVNRSRQRILFPNLSMLDLTNNNIRDIPIVISELSNLSVLHLTGNTQISRLPPEMGLLNRMWNLSLRGCNLNEPLKSMVESKKYKTMDIIGYLKSVLEDSKPYARMKLMVVGLQGIGKTSLLEQLRQEGYGTYRKKPPEHWAKRMGNKNVNLKTPKGVTLSTVGVDVCDWTYEKKVKGSPSFGPVTFRTWDFGGQKEYYSTHQYFLSRRSLYLVVWKMVDGEKAVEGIQQWLVNIQARAPNAPVIIVGTHYDLVKEFFPPFYAQDLQQTIRDKFINVVDADKCGLPRVIDSIEVSAKTKHNIKLLCNLIYDTVFGLRSPGSKERLLEQKIPATYLALEEVVSHLANQRISSGKDPVLCAAEYKELVSQEMSRRYKVSFRDASELQQATAFLHDNGVLLHYEDSTLKDLYFLEPQWLCDILAHVVTVREINPYARNGIMSTDDLKHLFKASSCAPSDTKTYIVNLLNKFEVALTWDSRTLLIPSLLPTEKLMVTGVSGADVRVKVIIQFYRNLPFSKIPSLFVLSLFPRFSVYNQNVVTNGLIFLRPDSCKVKRMGNPWQTSNLSKIPGKERQEGWQFRR
jgi:Leucine-rich repeat (LRR) protein